MHSSAIPQQRSLFDAQDSVDRLLQSLIVTWENVARVRKWLDERGVTRLEGELGIFANALHLECLRAEQLSRGIQVPKRAYRTRRVAATQH
jgi:hypothetical protein